jgi:molybdopterin molybdotransferase
MLRRVAGGSPLITIARARELVLAAACRSGPPTETVPIAEALDRVLAHDVAAAGDVPPFASSAMDGYAVTAGPAGRTLAVVGESRAGTPARETVTSTGAIRISTGAAVPDGAEAVIRQEDVTASGAHITTNAAVTPGDNIRRAGEDLKQGSTVLARGARLGVAEVGAAVAAGSAALTVAVRPRVTILSTGDELVAPGEPLAPGQIHNSNAPTLAALSQRFGAAVVRSDRVADERTATEAAFAQALRASDVLIISGGVSVGPHDHVKPALEALGVKERFWGVALQPGKPTWFGTRDATLVFGLPGNPVSAVVTFVLFAAPALRALQGARDETRAALAELAAPIRRNPSREQAVRVRLADQGARLTATPTGPQGSHLITSLVGADALALIPAGAGELPAGTHVELVPLPR